MGKGYWSGDEQPGAPGSATRPRCIACKRRIPYGDRCQECAHLVKVKAIKRGRRHG